MNPATLAGALEDSCSRWANRAALKWRGETTTYGALGESVAAVAGEYAALGIGHGDRVLCQVSNRPEHVVAAGAAWRLGAIHVGVDRDLVPGELARLIHYTGASAVVVEPAAVTSQAADFDVLAEFPDLAVVAVGDPDAVPGAWHFFDDLTARHRGRGAACASAPPAGPEPDDPAVILLTSGTTGAPRGVVRPHGRLAAGWRGAAELVGAGPDDVHLGQLPLSHGYGLGVAVAALLSGGRLVLLERFSAEDALRVIAEEGVTVLHGAPAHFGLLLDRLDPTRHDVRTLRAGTGSAASFSPPLLARILDELGMELVLCYGSSEGVGWGTADRDEMLRGSIGTPPGDSVRIVGPDGAALPPGQVGEIAFLATQPIRYWGEPEAAESNDGGVWHHTGDLGRLDDDGRLYVLGRLAHKINRGGTKVDPADVERALGEVAGVGEAAVVGVPDPVLGEAVCACVVPAPGAAPPRLHDLRRLLEPALARHKLPEALFVLDAIPRTSRGKVDWRELRDRAEAAPLERLRS